MSSETNAGRRGVINDDEATALLGPLPHHARSPNIPGCIATRHVLVLLAFLGFLNVYMMRINLSVAIVAMTDDNNKTITPIHHNECPGPFLNSTKKPKSTAKTFPWDEDTQNQILSSFFYGYILTQIPGGWFASRFGGKWIFGLGVLCTSFLSLLTPLAASAGVGWFIALRILEGIGEGVTYPAMYAIMAHWAPKYERSKMLITATSGGIFGTVIANPIAGVMCDSNFLQGWPSVFYLSGALGFIWFIFWALLIHDTPAKHPRISQEEREYIEKSIGPRQMTSMRVPIVSILTSVPVWGIIISFFCTAFGGYILLIDLPNYMKNVLKFDLSQSGFLSALPFVIMWLFYIIGSFIADFLRQNGYLSTVKTRKLFNSLGTLIAALSIAMVIYVGCNKYLAVMFFCISSIGSGLFQSGATVNHLDIAPKYAGVIFGIANMAGNSTGFLAPTIVGILTEGNNTKDQWQIVFWICCALYLLSFVTFVLMASGEEQPWAKNDPNGPVLDVNVDYNTSLVSDSDDPNEISKNMLGNYDER
ncbi:sialin-like [Amphiura filiformis]|uniref:sialin-like n=1 Tax=Amphiura filiformis TaxID=82378 RepID=UPI003B21C6F1